MDGSRLGDVRETEAAEAVRASVPATEPKAQAVPGAWSGFGSWPSSLGPAPGNQASIPRFAPPPRPASSTSVAAPPTAITPAPVIAIPVIPAPVIPAPVIPAIQVVAAPVDVPTPVVRPPSSAHSGPSREPTMRWQPSASGPRPAAQSGSHSVAATTIQPEAATSEPPAAGLEWQRPAWLAVAPTDADSEPEEELIGHVLGDRYRVEERIGSGGMGVVYRATHVLIGKRVAIKVLRRRFARQPEIAQRFAQEARIASSIKHPNVVDINDFGTTPGGCPYCVMEHLEGLSLAREIDRAGRLEPGLALDIAVQVARGLAAAHQAGVVHRDLKPDNVFLVRGEIHAGRTTALAKILDFGIARVAGNKTRLTVAGSVIGTPEYMSPEQARGDEVDARSDLYALGIMIFEALSGRVPLQGDSLAGTLTKQVFEPPPQLREIDPRLDGLPATEALLSRLLAKSREDRPSDALAVVRLLQAAGVHDLGRPEPESRPGGAGHVDAGLRPRRSTIMIGSGAITSAHTAVRVGDGPATGDFDAKDGGDLEQGKRPSVIIRDGEGNEGTPTRQRPARIVGQTRSDLIGPGQPASLASATVARATRNPTPEPEPSDEVRRRKRRRARRQHLPIVLLAAGAAIFAAFVTIGFVRWWQRQADSSSKSDSGRE